MSAFRVYLRAVKEAVDQELPRWLAPRVTRGKELSEATAAVGDAISRFVTRGGKRLRAVLLAASCEGHGGPRAQAILPSLLAVELLHAYLLMHDDWMDEDEVRRGGPTVHAMLRDHWSSVRNGEMGAILAGDLVAGYALEAFAQTQVPPERLAEALREFARIQVDVVLGQTLDVYTSGELEAMHDLKTNSYTVRGPLVLGALLAGASAADRTALEAFAWPLGIAFQLRDDLLGTFGDPSVTGKSAASDLQQCKRTALVRAFYAGNPSADDQALMKRVLGVKDAAPEDLAHAVERLRTGGAKAQVEARLEALLAEARSLLPRTGLSPQGRELLDGAVSVLGGRDQ